MRNHKVMVVNYEVDGKRWKVGDSTFRSDTIYPREQLPLIVQ